MIVVDQVNPNSRLYKQLDIMNRTTRDKSKGYFINHKILSNGSSRGDVQVRVTVRSLILGQMWKGFLTAITRILKRRVLKSKSRNIS